jgi:lantibiotic modifying enzyme
MKHLLYLLLLCIVFRGYAQQHDYLSDASKTERWLSLLKKQDSSGVFWPNAKDSSYTTTELYSGNCGVILFYLELYHTTSNKKYLVIAEKAAQYVLARLNNRWDEYQLGLYTGATGIAYTLHQTYVASGNLLYDEKAKQILSSLTGIVFEDSMTHKIANDIVYGYAGIGLGFLYAEKQHLLPDAKKQAEKIGQWLLKKSVPAGNGIRWPMYMRDTIRSFYMPNFSHGTAGVAYFFACLYEQTKNKLYLEAAIKASKHLVTIANKDGMIYHAEPDSAAMSRYYVSWCHGPAGTARLYYKLYSLTGDVSWKDKIRQVSDALMKCGIPEKQTAGYWNNVPIV